MDFTNSVIIEINLDLAQYHNIHSLWYFLWVFPNRECRISVYKNHHCSESYQIHATYWLELCYWVILMAWTLGMMNKETITELLRMYCIDRQEHDLVGRRSTRQLRSRGDIAHWWVDKIVNAAEEDTFVGFVLLYNYGDIDTVDQWNNLSWCQERRSDVEKAW